MAAHKIPPRSEHMIDVHLSSEVPQANLLVEPVKAFRPGNKLGIEIVSSVVQVANGWFNGGSSC